MKIKRLLIILTLLVLIIVPSSTAVSQTNASSIATTDRVSTDQTIAFLLKENEDDKNLIATQENRIADLETEVAIERENSASVGKSYEAAKAEIVNLKSANDSLRKAVATNEATIALLQTDNAKQKQIAKKANKEKWKARGAAALLLVLEVVRVIN